MGFRLHLGDKADSGYGIHNATSTNSPSDGNQHALIIGGVLVVVIMLMWVVCCIIMYKKKISLNVAQRVKNSMKNCRQRNASGNSVSYVNHASPLYGEDQQMVLPVIDLTEQNEDPSQERLPT